MNTSERPRQSGTNTAREAVLSQEQTKFRLARRANPKDGTAMKGDIGTAVLRGECGLLSPLIRNHIHPLWDLY